MTEPLASSTVEHSTNNANSSTAGPNHIDDHSHQVHNSEEDRKNDHSQTSAPAPTPHASSSRGHKPNKPSRGSAKFDVAGVLGYMHRAKQQAVRSWLVHELYEMRLRDIEMFLPQLLYLYLSGEPADTAPLRQFLKAKCEQSVHLGIKLVWILQSEAFYCTGTRLQLCHELLDMCEVAVVNSRVDATNIRAIARIREARQELAKLAQARLEMHDRKDSGIDEEKNNTAAAADTSAVVEDKSNEFSHGNALNQPFESVVESATVISPSFASGDQAREDDGTNVDSEEDDSHQWDDPDALNDPIDDDEQQHQQHSPPQSPTHTFSSVGSPSFSALSPLTESPGPASPIIVDDAMVHELFYSKQARSDYFNAILDCNRAMEKLSEALARAPRNKRQSYLSRFLEALDRDAARGLYFPCRNVEDQHYQILRIVEQDARVLNSRDKAPYLLFIEVAYSGRCCGDPDIYHIWQLEDVRHHAVTPGPKYSTDGDTSPVAATNQAVSVTGAGNDTLHHSISYEWVMLDRHINNEYFHPSKQNPADGKHSRSASSAGSHMDPKSAAYKRHLMRDRVFGTSWHLRKLSLRKSSRYSSMPNWDMLSVIFKGGDDLRQELLAMQLIYLFAGIFRNAQLPLQLRPYHVLITSPTAGLIETIPDAKSLDSIKKDTAGFESLLKLFESMYGERGTNGFDRAQRNFVESMAAYSLVCYFLSIKDRHNGNIMLGRDGHVIHIDYGFMLSNSPGGNANFESAPFKLTREFVEVMEGEDSSAFNYFRMLFLRGFLEARKYHQKITDMVAIMIEGSNMPCFAAGGPGMFLFPVFFVFFAYVFCVCVCVFRLCSCTD
jgi:Phosphatidylinositol 3- and 4-kinase/PI4KB/PIK1, accessory (PIK) domain